jgi:hypothetical protein
MGLCQVELHFGPSYILDRLAGEEEAEYYT